MTELDGPRLRHFREAEHNNGCRRSLSQLSSGHREIRERLYEEMAKLLARMKTGKASHSSDVQANS